MLRRGIAWFALLAASACPALGRAQTEPAGSDVVDPWRAHPRATPKRMLLDLEDPWVNAGPASELTDPWKSERKSGLRGRELEVVDPWNPDAAAVSPPPAASIPTRAFPLLDPWQSRAAEPAPRAPASSSVPTAAFPVVDVVSPW